MSISNLPGEVEVIYGKSVDDSLVGLLANKMSKSLVKAVGQHEPVHLVRVKMSGAQKADMVYLHSRYSSWENHPAVGAVIADLTPVGTKWFEGMVTSMSVGVSTLGAKSVFGTAGVGEPLTRNSLARIPADGGVAIAQDLALPKIADTCYTVVAGGREATTLVSTLAGMPLVYAKNDSNTVFWQSTMKPMFDKVRAAARRMGYREVHPTFEWYINLGIDNLDSPTGAYAINLSSSGLYACLKHGWKPFVVSSTGSSLVILVPDDGSGKHFVCANKRLTDVGNTSAMNFVIREFVDPRYAQSLDVFDSNYQMTACLSYLRNNYFVDARAAVDAFGLTPAGYNKPEKIQLDNAQRSPFSRQTIEYFTGLRQAYLLPLIAPPGKGEYFASFSTDVLAVKRNVMQWDALKPMDASEAFIGDPSDTSWANAVVKETEIDLPAERLLTGVTSDWYMQYLSKGYGFFEPRSDAEVTKARALVTSYEGLVLTACAYDKAFMLPNDIVEQLQIYRLYKKSRDKACLSNDFMKKEMANGMTWGTANSLCNGSRSTAVLYGYKETLGSSFNVAPQVGGATSVVYTLKGVTNGMNTVLTRTGSDADGDVTSVDVDLVFGDLAMGATLKNITTSALLTAWGADPAAITAEQAALKADVTHINRYGGANGRGYGLAPYDFGFENLGVSGYPVYEQMPRDDAMKMAIISKSQIQKKTETLRQAYLGFATSAIVSNFLKR